MPMKSEEKFNQDKSALRNQIKQYRRELSEKQTLSSQICSRFLHSQEYRECSAILCYLPLPDEVDTKLIIQNAFKDKKKVGVPYCLDKQGNMDFFCIESFDDLHIGSFGILEPNVEKCKRIESFKDSIIIVPALCFDKNGNRLGYGKGYYDRFFQKHSLISFGLCYNSLILDYIPADEFDRGVDYIITEKQIINCIGGQNG